MATAAEKFDRFFLVPVTLEDVGTLMPLLMEMSRGDLHEAARTGIEAFLRNATPEVSPPLDAGPGSWVRRGRLRGRVAPE